MKWSLFIRTNTLWSASKIKLFPWTLYHFIEAIVERSPLSRSEQLRDLNAFVGPKGPDLHPFLFGIDIKGGTGHLLLYFRNRLDGGRGGERNYAISGRICERRSIPRATDDTIRPADYRDPSRFTGFVRGSAVGPAESMCLLRYFIYGHEEVLENRFQSNWNGTRVEPVYTPRYERGTLFRVVPLSRLFIGCNMLTFFALTRAVPFRSRHALDRFELRPILRKYLSPLLFLIDSELRVSGTREDEIYVSNFIILNQISPPRSRQIWIATDLAKVSLTPSISHRFGIESIRDAWRWNLRVKLHNFKPNFAATISTDLNCDRSCESISHPFYFSSIRNWEYQGRGKMKFEIYVSNFIILDRVESRAIKPLMISKLSDRRITKYSEEK